MDPVPVFIARLGLALLFAAAAAHKLRDLPTFRATLAGYRLLPARLVPALAPLLAGAELALAVALLLPATGADAAVAGAGLLALYSAAIATNLARGRRDIDCGCLGPAQRQTLSGGLLLRNAALLAGAVVAALPPLPRTVGWIDAATIAFALVTLVLLFAAASHLGAATAAARDAHLRRRHLGSSS
jgi:hypothetical protein